MKSMIRSGLRLFGVSIVGMLLLQMAKVPQAKLAAADPPPRLEKAAPQREPSQLPAPPAAIKETQILLRVTILELHRAKMDALGIDFKTARAESPPSREAPGARVSSWRFFDPSDARQVANLLVENEMAKVLAEPVMVMTVGRRARYDAGGKVAVTVPDGAGATKPESRQIGTSLEVMPTSLPDGAVRLEMQVDLAELDHSNGVVLNGVKVPALNRRQIQTAVELQLGTTAMLRSQELLVMVTPESAVSQARNDHPPRQRGASNEMVRQAELSIPLPAPRPIPAVGPASITLTTLIYTFNSKTLQTGGVDVREAVQAFEGMADVFTGAAEGEQANAIVSVIDPRGVAALKQRLANTIGARVLSRPQVRTLSGKPAQIQLLQRVTLPASADVQPTSAEFRNVGLTLDVVPIVKDDRLLLTARAERSKLVESKVEAISLLGMAELYPGETLAICQNDEQDDQLLVLLTPVSTVSHIPAQAPAILPAQAPNGEPGKRRSTEARLEALKTFFGPNHPQVVRQQQEPHSLDQQRTNRTPVDLQTLRDELRELRQDVKSLRRDVRRLTELRQDRAAKTGR